MLRTCIEKRRKKEKKKIWLQLDSNRERLNGRVRTPEWESNVTTTAPEHYVFKKESSFYIITYSS